jgi:branched-chain amino acid transport system ATP-binding protein
MEVKVTKTILRVDNLSMSFDGLHAMDNLSLSIPTGCIVALIGPNGAGKTTLFNLICGFLSADSGVVQIVDTETTMMRPERIAQLGLGRSFQDCKVFEQMSALDNVLLGCAIPRPKR